MKCEVCRGACCETVEVVGQVSGDEFPTVTSQYLEARSVGRTVRGGFVIASVCPKLTIHGLCSIHDEKPLACALYPVGGAECLASIAARRSPLDYQAIRDEDDPETIHELGLQSSTPGE